MLRDSKLKNEIKEMIKESKQKGDSKTIEMLKEMLEDIWTNVLNAIMKVQLFRIGYVWNVSKLHCLVSELLLFYRYIC